MTHPDRRLATFHVAGHPRTKGSLKVITPRGRRPILVEDHKHSAPWRKRIITAIKINNPEVNRPDHIPCKLPVSVLATFVFERVGLAARALSWPVVNAGVNASGDLDKLLRNLLDALKDSGLIADDCLVVSVGASKAWAAPGVDPGVYVEVSYA